MNHSLNSKIYALRFKTDRDLTVLIAKTVERGLRAARTLAYDDAEKAYEQAQSWVRVSPHRERSRLEQRLAELRRTLDATTRVHAACG
jgi:hypothetical protein